MDLGLGASIAAVGHLSKLVLGDMEHVGGNLGKLPLCSACIFCGGKRVRSSLDRVHSSILRFLLWLQYDSYFASFQLHLVKFIISNHYILLGVPCLITIDSGKQP